MKKVFTVLLLALVSHTLAFSQTTDTLRLTTCLRFWKNGNPPKVAAWTNDLVLGNGLVGIQSDTATLCTTFLFSPPSAAQGLCISMKGDDPHADNGVTIADLAIIAQHLLGVQPLTPDILRLAADANKSNSITTFDIVELRKLILHIYDELPNNVDWIAVPDYLQLANPSNPFSMTTCSYNYTPGLLVDTVTMIAMKIGDVDGDANALGMFQAPGNPTAELSIPNQTVTAGQQVDIPVFMTPGKKIMGLQAGFKVAPAAAVLGIAPGTLNIDNNSAALYVGQINVVGLASGPVVSTNQPLFYLKVKAIQSFQTNDVFSLDANTFTNVWVDDTLKIHPFNLALTTGTSEPESGIRVGTAYPNPASGPVYLPVTLEASAPYTLEVWDAMGKKCHSAAGQLSAGPQTLSFSRNDLGGIGMYFYQLSVGEKVFSGKVTVE